MIPDPELTELLTANRNRYGGMLERLTMSDTTETIAAQLTKLAEPHLSPDENAALAKLAPSLIDAGIGALGVLQAEMDANPHSVAQLAVEHLDFGDDILAAWDDNAGKWYLANVAEAKKREALTQLEQSALTALRIGIPIAIQLLGAM